MFAFAKKSDLSKKADLTTLVCALLFLFTFFFFSFPSLRSIFFLPVLYVTHA